MFLFHHSCYCRRREYLQRTDGLSRVVSSPFSWGLVFGFLSCSPRSSIFVASSEGSILVVPFSGYWFLHCHFLYHVTSGMAVILHVGEHSDLPPIPAGFPKCGSFTPQVYKDWTLNTIWWLAKHKILLLFCRLCSKSKCKYKFQTWIKCYMCWYANKYFSMTRIKFHFPKYTFWYSGYDSCFSEVPDSNLLPEIEYAVLSRGSLQWSTKMLG